MNWIKKIRSISLAVFVLIFFSAATLNSCGNKDKNKESTEQSEEENAENTEHPTSDEEHPTGDEEHPTSDDEDSTAIE